MAAKKILFCTDFSQNSEPARDLAVDYAKALGAELVIIHVIDSSAFPDFFPGYEEWIGDEIQNILARAEEQAVGRLQELADECRRQVIVVKTFCSVGPPPYEIVRIAAEEAADLIVLGTHGRTGVKHLVMGSISRSVLRMAHRPILIVQGPQAAGESSERP